MGNPASILDWLRGTSARGGTVVDPPKEPSRKQLLILHRPDLPSLAEEARIGAPVKRAVS